MCPSIEARTEQAACYPCQVGSPRLQIEHVHYFNSSVQANEWYEQTETEAQAPHG